MVLLQEAGTGGWRYSQGAETRDGERKTLLNSFARSHHVTDPGGKGPCHSGREGSVVGRKAFLWPMASLHFFCLIGFPNLFLS